MTTEWVITSAAERVDLDAGNKGETTFTVTNPNPRQDLVVFEVVPGEGADGSWFVPPEEPQRLVPGNGSAQFTVKIAVPAGVPAGSHWFQARAYSADAAPEEGSRLSGRIAFDVKASVKPKKPWWPYAVAAALVLVVLAVVGILVFGGDDEPQAQPSPTPSPSPSPPRPRPTPIRSGQLDIPQTFLVDFDTGVVGSSPGSDIWFQAQTATVRDFTVRGSAKQRYLGVGADTDPRACTGLSANPIPFLNLAPGGVLCVQTNEGRIAVATVVSRVDPSPGRIVLRYQLYASAT